MMLANTEQRKAKLIGQSRLSDHIAKHLGLRSLGAVGIGRDVPERIQTNFDFARHAPLTLLGGLTCRAQGSGPRHSTTTAASVAPFGFRIRNTSGIAMMKIIPSQRKTSMNASSEAWR